MQNTKAAFEWIVNVLMMRKIPFQITGGLAANVYGAGRALYDIDIDLPQDCLGRVCLDAGERVIFKPYRLKDENWDLWLATLRYKNQDIDVCAGETIRIRGGAGKRWRRYPFNLRESVKKEVFGRVVPVIGKENLIAYKNILGRECDREDVDLLEK